MRNVDAIAQDVDEDLVHSIDMWFSERRKLWVIERLDANGDLVGSSHCCGDADAAADCLAEWMRAHHGGLRFVAPPSRPVRQASTPPKRRAA